MAVRKKGYINYRRSRNKIEISGDAPAERHMVWLDLLLTRMGRLFCILAAGSFFNLDALSYLWKYIKTWFP